VRLRVDVHLLASPAGLVNQDWAGFEVVGSVVTFRSVVHGLRGGSPLHPWHPLFLWSLARVMGTGIPAPVTLFGGRARVTGTSIPALVALFDLFWWAGTGYGDDHPCIRGTLGFTVGTALGQVFDVSCDRLGVGGTLQWPHAYDYGPAYHRCFRGQGFRSARRRL
jgi:hypothetical protein